MRRALLTALLVLAGTRAASADPIAGYDHVIHDGYVEVKGIDAPGCEHCHALDRRQQPVQPGHAACFGSSCHVMPRGGVAPAPATLCLACHDTARPGKGARAHWAGEASRDFGLTFPHDRHGPPSHAAGRAGCLDCHVAPSAKAAPAPAKKKPALPPGAHDRCVGCHGAAAPAPPAPSAPAPFAMVECARCHRSIAGRFVAPAQLDSPYGVGAGFSHDAHLARQAGPPATRCLACHAQVEATAGAQIPAPSMATCESCHDGKQAFAALGNRCRNCHVRGTALPAAEPPRLFDHRQHIAAGAPARCESCHALDATFTPRPVEHAACADARCHAGEFRTRTPRICGGCHVGSEPWRPLRADAARREHSEFGAEYSHRTHGARPGPACAECHTGVRGGLPMRLGRAHASCAGDACHTRSAPRLADCASCHQLGVLPDRDDRRAASRWSVAARFDHAAHDRDVLDQPVQCLSCHVGVLDARRVAEIPVPRKAVCAGCHDGVLGFKMTGHACGRCHGHASHAEPGSAEPDHVGP